MDVWWSALVAAQPVGESQFDALQWKAESKNKKKKKKKKRCLYQTFPALVKYPALSHNLVSPTVPQFAFALGR